jgi:hypothetical protein
MSIKLEAQLAGKAIFVKPTHADYAYLRKHVLTD